MIIPDQQQTHPADKALDDLIQFIYNNTPYLQEVVEKMRKVFDEVRQQGYVSGEKHGFGQGERQGESRLLISSRSS